MNIILQTLNGSRAYGTEVEGSDYDTLGIYVPTAAETLGIEPDPKTRQVINGEDDRTFYPLRQWARLAAAGNPSSLALLYAPPVRVPTVNGMWLRDNADAFMSKDVGRRHLGYLNSQRQQMNSQNAHDGSFNTKFAYHVIRLGMQGVEAMRYGKLSFPLNKYQVQTLRDVRGGLYTLRAVQEMAENYVDILESAIRVSDLPDHADPDRINDMLKMIQLEEWQQGR